MITSILESIKKVIGFEKDYEVFDQDLIMHINSTFAVLHQLGVGPAGGFSIQGYSETWNDFLEGPHPTLNMVQTYMYIKTRLLFDRPENSFATESLEQQASEYEWRMMVEKETPTLPQKAQIMNNELEHYGVKGMRWGHRKNNYNKNYTYSQRRQDQSTYGRRGEKRINKEMNRGAKIKAARSYEKTRRDKVLGTNKYYRQVGKMLGGGAAGLGGFLLSRQVAKMGSTYEGRRKLIKYLGADIGMPVAAFSQHPAVQIAVASGAAKIGTLLSGDAAVGLRMKAHGYKAYRR